MPNCFQLFPIGSDTAEKLSVVDEQICEYMNEAVHPRHYCQGWFDAIGFQIAMGNELGSQELRDKIAEYEDSILMSILSFLESKYSSNAFYAHK